MLLFTPDVRRKPSRVAFGKRTSDSGIFAGFIWSVQGRPNFRSADTGFGRGLSAVTDSMLFRMFSHACIARCGGISSDARGCMMWRWETKDPHPSEPRKGYCGLAGTPFAFTAQ
jgi:hypothetical protein